MAIEFLSPISLNKLELQNVALQNLAVAPTTPVAGQIYWDTALTSIRIWNGTAWKDIVFSTSIHTQNTDVGTSSTSFYIGASGPLIKNVSGNFQLRNSGDTASVGLTVGDMAITGNLTVTGTAPFPRKFTTSVHAATTAVAITHSLGTTAIHATVQRISDGQRVEVDWKATSGTVATFTFGSNPVANTYSFTIEG
jgi:hypothetical protein